MPVHGQRRDLSLGSNYLQVEEQDPEHTDGTIIWYWPMKFTLIVFGSYSGFGWLYFGWTLLVGCGYASIIILQAYRWVNGEQTIMNSTSVHARIAGLAYFIAMFYAFGATTHLMRCQLKNKMDMVDLVKEILQDWKLFEYCNRRIRFLSVFIAGYIIFTTYAYRRELERIDDQRYLIVCFAYLMNFQFGACIMLYCLCCWDVQHKIHITTQEAAEHQTVSELKDGFERICQQLEALGNCWNAFLSVQNFCVLAKCYSSLSISNTAHTASYWLEFMLMARMIAMVVAINLIGAHVGHSARGIHTYLLNWTASRLDLRTVVSVRRASGASSLSICDRRSANSDPDANTTECLVDSHFQHLFLMKLCEKEVQNNFKSLRIFGIPLTTTFLSRYAYLIVALSVRTLVVKPEQHNATG